MEVFNMFKRKFESLELKYFLKMYLVLKYFLKMYLVFKYFSSKYLLFEYIWNYLCPYLCFWTKRKVRDSGGRDKW